MEKQKIKQEIAPMQETMPEMAMPEMEEMAPVTQNAPMQQMPMQQMPMQQMPMQQMMPMPNMNAVSPMTAMPYQCPYAAQSTCPPMEAHVNMYHQAVSPAMQGGLPCGLPSCPLMGNDEMMPYGGQYPTAMYPMQAPAMGQYPMGGMDQYPMGQMQQYPMGMEQYPMGQYPASPYTATQPTMGQSPLGQYPMRYF